MGDPLIVTQYIKCLVEADQLPDNIEKLKQLFNRDYSPRQEAIKFIKQTARKDDDLYDNELARILMWEKDM